MEADGEGEEFFEGDIIESPLFDQEDDRIVMGYNEMEQRTRGGAEIMGTTIEGGGALARAQQRIEARQADTVIDKKLLFYFGELRRIEAPFAKDDEVAVLDKFHTLPYYQYKNPLVFLLAYIGNKEGELSKARLERLMQFSVNINVLTIAEEDIVRYYRRLTSLA